MTYIIYDELAVPIGRKSIVKIKDEYNCNFEFGQDEEVCPA